MIITITIIDNKDFFHFHPDLFKTYGDFLTTQPVVWDFVQKAKPVWDLVYQVIGAILRAFEPDFPGVYNLIFDTESPHILLRFLKYKWYRAGRYLAKPHYDAGSFTLAIAESEPGLRVGSCQNDLVPVVHQFETALFMISSNFSKAMDTDTLQPAWHD